MGRAGRGGGSSSRGGSFRSSRSSGSFRSSSSRAGRSSSSSSCSSYRSNIGSSYHSNVGSSYHSRPRSTSYSSINFNSYSGTGHSYNVSRSYYGGRGKVSLLSDIVITLCIILAIILFAVIVVHKKEESSIVRVKLETENAYDRNVVLKDELDWIESENELGTKMHDFFKVTGVQPYFILLDYNENLKSDDEKEAYATSLYDEYLKREDALLYVYFGEYNPDDVGLTCYALGKQVDSVFDSEALEIWYDCIMKYWYNDISTVDVFVRAYNECAEKIMRQPADYSGTLKILIVTVGIVGGLLAISKLVKIKAKADKDKAEATEKILNTPLERFGSSEVEELKKKYDNE